MQQQSIYQGLKFDADLKFNPVDYRFHAAQKSVYLFLRDYSPVHYNDFLNLYVLSCRADLVAALKNDNLYSFFYSDAYEALHFQSFADIVGIFCQDALEHNLQRRSPGAHSLFKVGNGDPPIMHAVLAVNRSAWRAHR